MTCSIFWMCLIRKPSTERASWGLVGSKPSLERWMLCVCVWVCTHMHLCVSLCVFLSLHVCVMCVIIYACMSVSLCVSLVSVCVCVCVSYRHSSVLFHLPSKEAIGAEGIVPGPIDFASSASIDKNAYPQTLPLSCLGQILQHHGQSPMAGSRVLEPSWTHTHHLLKLPNRLMRCLPHFTDKERLREVISPRLSQLVSSRA